MFVAAVMLLASVGFALGGTAIDVLFFTRFGAHYLSYAYIPLGVLLFLTSFGVTALLGRVRRDQLYIFILILVFGSIVVAWFILFSGALIVYPVLWLGKEIINVWLNMALWGVAGTIYDTRQSKRLYPIFNAGRILGAVIGGLNAGGLVGWMGAQNLILVWAALLIPVVWLSRVLLSAKKSAATTSTLRRRQVPIFQEMQQGYQIVRGSTLLRWISVAAILSAALFFSVALIFSEAAATKFPNENELANFLGVFNGVSAAAAFLVSTFLAHRIYARVGVMNAILALFVVYLIGFGGVALANLFAVIVCFRFAQIVWMQGVEESATQTMFNTLPDANRDQARAFISGVPEQAGTLIAGALYIVGEKMLTAQQLAVVGLGFAVVTAYFIWRARFAYNASLVDTLHQENPNLFNSPSLQFDAKAVKAALQNFQNKSLITRRVSIEILGKVSNPQTESVFLNALRDKDAEIRVTALKNLAKQKTTSTIEKIIPLLSDPEAEVRAQTVDSLLALAPAPRDFQSYFSSALEDVADAVKIRASVALLTIDSQHRSRDMIRKMIVHGDVDQRILALSALTEIRDPEAYALLFQELNDENNPPAVRCAAVSALATYGIRAIPILQNALAAKNFSVKSRAASALGKIGEAALSEVVNALDNPLLEEGALLALEHLSAQKEAERIQIYVKQRSASALYFNKFHLSVKAQADERIRLLSKALRERARRDGLYALQALSLLREREAFAVAIANLQNTKPRQVANAIETLESTQSAALIRPLFSLWETSHEEAPLNMDVKEIIVHLTNEPDEWLQACANFAAEKFAKEKNMETLHSLSTMERVILLNRVPLFSTLSLSEMKKVATITAEQDFADGECICKQNEYGDDMYVIVSGTAKVIVENEARQEKEVARLKVGDVIGEMSVISGDTRIASVIAVGALRVISLDRLSFENLLHEQPEVSLAMMRELCNRLRDVTNLQTA